MSEAKIPSAAVLDDDISVVAVASPADAIRLKELQCLFDRGTDTPDDLIVAATLLAKHGLMVRSEALLRANTLSCHDKVYDAYRKLHGNRLDVKIESSMEVFERQFGVSLVERQVRHFLKWRCVSMPVAIPATIDEHISRFLQYRCGVDFDLLDEVPIADISCDELTLIRDYLLLKFREGEWTVMKKGGGSAAG